MCKTKNAILFQTNDLVSGIHDKILDDNKMNLADAYMDAVVWVAELQLQLNKLNNSVSSGYIRTDTSKIKKTIKQPFIAVDGGDSWLRTGKIA